MAEVRSLHGTPVVQQGEPDPDVVEVLEESLNQAKAGRTQAIAIFTFDRADNYTLTTAGDVYVQRLIGLLAQAQHELIANKLRHEDEGK